jgi:hypothetical protein
MLSGATMSLFDDPKRTSRVFIAFGGITLALCARLAPQAQTPLPLIGAYIGFVVLIRGLWLGWKSRKL